MTVAVNSRVKIHSGRVFELRQENLTLPNGVTVDLDLIHHPGAAAIVPFIQKDTILLLRQYRHAVGDFIWEIPAGTIRGDETPLHCATRELVEETGFSAALFAKLGEVIPVPGYSDERIHLFTARELSPAEQHLDEDELFTVCEYPTDVVLKMIAEGHIVDAKTIVGILMALVPGIRDPEATWPLSRPGS
jgi:ADP-ribose pyrophosphatase